MAYITPQGSYYEGDRAHALDAEVPQRPSHFHAWDGAAWVLDQAAKDAADAEVRRAAVQAKLDAIDVKSIRALREWVAVQPNAPQVLKDREVEAVVERGKLPR